MPLEFEGETGGSVQEPVCRHRRSHPSDPGEVYVRDWDQDVDVRVKSGVPDRQGEGTVTASPKGTPQREVSPVR